MLIVIYYKGSNSNKFLNLIRARNIERDSFQEFVELINLKCFEGENGNEKGEKYGFENNTFYC